MVMEERVLAQPATVPMRLGVVVPVDDQEDERKPSHLTIVLQGHKQWAQDQALSHSDAVNAAAGRLLELIDFCAMRSIKKVTLCLFSEDLHRLPLGGNGELFSSFMRYITAGALNLHRNDVRLQIEGPLENLDSITRGLLCHVARRTHLNKGMHLVVRINAPTGDKSSRTLSADRESPQAAHDFDGAEDGDPDFVIRTGGPMPVHRTMLWDTRKTALYFTNLHWPAFDAKSLQAALDWYGETKRSVGIESAKLVALTGRHH